MFVNETKIKEWVDDINFDDAISLPDLITRLEQANKALSVKYPHGLSVETYRIELYGVRDATAEEIEQEKASQRAWAANTEKRERAELARLKAKYEGK